MRHYGPSHCKVKTSELAKNSSNGPPDMAKKWRQRVKNATVDKILAIFHQLGIANVLLPHITPRRAISRTDRPRLCHHNGHEAKDVRRRPDGPAELHADHAGSVSGAKVGSRRTGSQTHDAQKSWEAATVIQSTACHLPTTPPATTSILPQ